MTHNGISTTAKNMIRYGVHIASCPTFRNLKSTISNKIQFCSPIPPDGKIALTNVTISPGNIHPNTIGAKQAATDKISDTIFLDTHDDINRDKLILEIIIIVPHIPKTHINCPTFRFIRLITEKSIWTDVFIPSFPQIKLVVIPHTERHMIHIPSVIKIDAIIFTIEILRLPFLVHLNISSAPVW